MKPISAAEPVSDLRRIPIRECGQPLVDFTAIPRVVLGAPRFDYRRETLMRVEVAERLAIAAASLPPGYRLSVIEGWRAPHIQRRLYLMVWNRMKAANPTWSDVRLRRLVNRFTAPMNPRVPPPHTTGGAMDVELIDDAGKVHDLCSPFDRRDIKCYAFAASGLSVTARQNRQILHDALAGAGITNYPSEFWHYSYGDQGWAYRGGHPEAVYGAITPVDWTPDPRDDVDSALEFIDK